MRDHHIRLVLVMDAGKLEGIISQGDCIAKVLLPGLSAKEVLAKEIMTSNLIYAAETDDLDSCMQTMISKRIHYLPVKNEDEFIGVLSIGDAIRHTFNEKTSQIGSLERQIKEWDNSQH
jgi:CBS domain-containing protein